MFDELSTVFILGAGASRHYGYPTGVALVDLVVRKATTLSTYYDDSAKNGNLSIPRFLRGRNSPHEAWQSALLECGRLRRGLIEANPLVIDYFLGLNPELQELGKLLIGWVILECTYKAGGDRRREAPHEGDWCRFLTHKLTTKCQNVSDLLRNRVSFVTFNYDLSLEQRLLDGLKHVQYFKDEDIRKFLEGRITHVYGKLGAFRHDQTQWSVQDRIPGGDLMTYQMHFTALLDAIYLASSELRVIDPHSKEAGSNEILIARRKIFDAERVFILGYGFDENNNERLALVETLRNKNKKILFTNYENNNNVNKRISKVLFGGEQEFRGGESIFGNYERSTRDVYEAFARDFDL